jgi:rhodanese-related sulfurtransferase
MAALAPAASLGAPLTSGRFSQAPTSPVSSAPRRNIAAAAGAYSNCSCSDAAKMVTADKSHAYLDVRTPAEFQAAHVPGAVNVPVWLPGAAGMMSPNPDFVAQVQQEFPDSDVALCVGCKVGGRSKAAVELLSGVGYTGLVNVEGGFDAWAAQGLPVTR